MIVTSREDLNEQLWIDYQNHKDDRQEQSFIYQYTKKKKDGWAEIIARSRQSVEEYEKAARRDKYTLLKSAYLAYCGDVITEADYLRILKGVARVGVKLTREQREEKKRTGKAFAAKAAAKYDRLSGKEAIDAAQRQWERALLKGTVSDFFNNLGYRASRDGSSEKPAEKHSRMQHVYGDYFDLLFQFQLYSAQAEIPPEGRDAAFPASDRPDEEYIQKCEQFFRQLNREEMTDVIVPLFCDRRSGAGVYVIGIDEIEGQAILMDGLIDPGSCVPCIAYYSDISAVDMDQMAFEMTVEAFNTVREAFDHYTAKCFKGDFFENYAFGNEDRGYEQAPEGIDPCFQPFFQKTGSRRKSIIRQEAQLEKEGREREKMINDLREHDRSKGKRSR